MPKIFKNGAGAALLKEPALVGQIVTAMRNEAGCPVTIKLRSGISGNSINYLEVAQRAVDAGAAMVTLHPRTVSQRFSGQANWQHLSELKKFLCVPVIGSGDLFSAEDVQRMLNETGCDGVMIARGAQGNPFIFQDTLGLLSKGKKTSGVNHETRLKTALKQLELSVKYKGQHRACREMRKHFCAYSRGIPGSAEFRRQVVQAATLSDYQGLVFSFLRENGKNKA